MGASFEVRMHFGGQAPGVEDEIIGILKNVCIEGYVSGRELKV